uniref:Agenet domain-containing protein n=1 Tax=Populus trichocarpa TaxID=3694 RepID=A0A2K2BYQ2_POPTR
MQNQTIFFNKGEEVEVSSDKEGFRGAWYLATILEFPKPQPQATVKSASKKKRKTIVQYKTLVTEDDFAPLVEQVGPHLIGPLPRNFYWKMVDLRLHLDWVDDNWVRPKMQRQTIGSVLSSRTEVEVKLEKDNIRDIWLPAICLSSRNSDEAGTKKTIVDSLCIQSTPPHYADRNYELLERVGTCYGFGRRYRRRYKFLFGSGHEAKELSHSKKMRPHLEWADGKWISKSKV